MSTLLRIFQVKDEEFNSGLAEELTKLQFKNLQRGVITEFSASVLDNTRDKVDIGYLSVVLHRTRDG